MWAWLVIGLILGAAFAVLARVLNERRTIAAGLVIAASVYVIFAAAGGASGRWLGLELLGLAVYGSMAYLGLRYSQWWLVLGWAAHPVWDIALHLMSEGSAFAPAWYVTLCVSFDAVVALYLSAQWWHQSKSNKVLNATAGSAH